jgi:magnesium and cobalt transporter
MKTTTMLFLQDKLNLFLDLPKDREHLLSILHNARRKNLIALDAMKMMEGALQVSQTHAHEIMIPRAQMIVISQDDRPEDFLPTVISSQHSRFPVIGESRDDVLGILLAKDLLSYLAEEKDSRHFNMRDLLRPAFFIPESKRLDVLLREFRTNRNHMAIIVDEYAGVAGLVTIEDVIEEIVGNIEDEYDLEEAVYIKPREEGFYTVRALTPVEIFNQYFKVSFSDEEFDTIGGILTQTFGYLPKRGETLELHGLSFEVVRADKKRLHLLRVRPVLS